MLFNHECHEPQKPRECHEFPFGLFAKFGPFARHLPRELRGVCGAGQGVIRDKNRSELHKPVALFITQRFNRVELRGAERGIQAEHHAGKQRNRQRQWDAIGREQRNPFIQSRCERDAEDANQDT